MNDHRCRFCNMKIECIQHQFLECDYVQNLWTTFENFINETWANVINLEVKEEIIWFGNTKGCNVDELFTLCCYLQKISCMCILGKPLFNKVFLKQFSTRFKSEEYLLKVNKEHTQILMKWFSYMVVAQDDGWIFIFCKVSFITVYSILLHGMHFCLSLTENN